jgi:multicomponent Na+:H+ antiporter subunit C
MTATVPFNVPFLAVAALIGIALYVIIFKRNLIKLVMGIVILEAGVNLFLVTLGYRQAGVAPIYTNAPEGVMVLPVPQALTLTSIVIGVSILALMLSMIVHTYRHTGDIDAERSRRMKG